ncbi:hypothetical protein [Halarcobacter sp.]|uniref:hypothetical protein n=1 Tax=Halarcobacter sp. TaxID=2321133 RepID=UPI002AAB5E10|nr:hypothetical protein [Halarcobacter sp.]
MKKHLIKFILIFVLSVKDLFGLMGMGDIVSDPTSYSYYAKQIKAMNDEVKTALDQLESLNKVNDALDQANDLINNAGERIFNPKKTIMGIVDNITGIQDKFQSMTERVKNMGVERFFKEYHNINEPLKDELLEKWNEDFKSLFDNKEDEKYQDLNERVLSTIKSKNYIAYQKAVQDLNEYVKLKGIEQEALKKYSLLGILELYNDYFINESTVQERNESLARVKKLAEQIKSEQDVVKQQQTTNQFLLEMLNIQQAQYEMQMKFFYAVSMNMVSENSNTNYDVKKVIEERKNYTNRNKKTMKNDSSISTEKYINNLINSKSSNSIDDLLNGKIN